MVQEFHVVRCFKCQTFQVQQVKKVNRWCCKLCGAKQSLLKEFGRGSGAYCRRHVQKLNATRGAVIEKQEHQASLWEQVKEAKEDRDDEVTQNHVSRWSKYLDPPEADPEDHSPNCSNSSPVLFRQQATDRPTSLNKAGPQSLGTTRILQACFPRYDCPVQERKGPSGLTYQS